MGETVTLRVLAALAMLLGATVLVRAARLAIADPAAEDWRRLAARVAFGLALLYVARLAWMRPRSRPSRVRKRILRLVAVLARPDLQRDFAESSPSVGLADALLADWSSALRLVDHPTFAAAFDADERGDLLALDAEVRRQAPAVPRRATPDEALQLEREPAWLAIQVRAAATLDRFVQRTALSGS